MSELTGELKRQLEAIALEVVTMEATDIPAMGNILNGLSELEGDSQAVSQPAFLDVTRALKGYLERLILRETEDLEPLEKGIDYLQSICRQMCNRGAFDGETSEILNRLG